jgi:hypothetical protein
MTAPETLHSIFKATLDHGAPSRQDRSKGECCHSVASAKRASAHKEEAIWYSQLQLT